VIPAAAEYQESYIAYAALLIEAPWFICNENTVKMSLLVLILF